MTDRDRFDQWLCANERIALRLGEHEENLLWLAWQAALAVERAKPRETAA